MECEVCALDGQVGEASSRCAECNEWVCDLHTKSRADGAPLCPSCFDAQDEAMSKATLDEEPESTV